MTCILALDHGSRRVGVAIGETETGLAFARPALVRRGGEQDVEAVAGMVREEGVQTILVGLPLKMDGSEGREAAAARAFGQRLAVIGPEIVYVDERLSSWQAGEELKAAGRRPSRRSGELDSAAARLFLQQYLDDDRRQPAPKEAR
ncbi:MAG: Holliday junction resolvase RuvX [Chloroflexota bacterium]|nr:Holliday junction resolvase RuvX [Chloroflexota bacterium]